MLDWLLNKYATVNYIKVSKTDQFGKGYHTCARSLPCWTYLSVRVTSKGPLFLLANGQPLTHAVLVVKVRLALSTRGMDVEKYSGHSFRIGAITTVLCAGISDAKIEMLGC